MTGPEILRTAALIAAASLRGDDKGVSLLLNTLHPDHVRIVAVASVEAMAGLVREFVPPDAIQCAVTSAQQLARDAATEGNPT